MKQYYTIPALLISTIVAINLSLPWYVGIFFVWGVIDLVARMYRAVEATNMEIKNK